MLTGRIRIETENKIVEQPMRTITKGFAEMLRHILATTDALRNPVNSSFSGLGCFDPVNNNHNFINLISFDDSAIGYDKDMNQITPFGIMDSFVCNNNSKFEVLNASYGFFEDGEGYINISKKFKNISGSAYTLRRVFLNLMTIDYNSSSNSKADHFNNVLGCSHLTIACETVNYTVQNNETVVITYRIKPLNINRNFRSILKAYLSLVYKISNAIDTSIYLINQSNVSTNVRTPSLRQFNNDNLPKTGTGLYVINYFNNSSSKVIMIGSDNTDNPNIDYKLLSPISESLYTTSGLSFNIENLVGGNNQNVVRFSIILNFFNSSASALSIGEIGTFLNTYLFHRLTLPSVLSLPAGQGIEVSFNFDCFVGESYTITNTACTGSGTVEDPYIVSSLANLYWVSQNPSTWDKQFLQTQDIDASITKQWLFGTDKGSGFPSIGSKLVNFTGTYNGGGHSIDGLYLCGYSKDSDITLSTLNQSALFSHAKNAVIKDLTISNSLMECNSFVSGFFSDICSGSSFINCVSKNNKILVPSKSTYYYGSISGRDLTGSSFTGCINEGLEVNFSYENIAYNYYIGGICGESIGGAFSSCINKSITLNNKYNLSLDYLYIAGICAMNNSIIATNFTKCVNLANMNIPARGLAGISARCSGYESFFNCVNKGNLTNLFTGGSVAGISINNSSSGTKYIRCYNSGTIKSASIYSAGLAYSPNYEHFYLDCINTGDLIRSGSGAHYYPFAYSMKSLGSSCGRNLNVGRVFSSEGVLWQEAGNNIRGFACVAPSGTITNYFDSTYTQQQSGAGATAKTTTECKTQATYSGWDFTNVWGIDPAINNGYPYLREIVAFFPQ